ncbi:MAG: MATE family efflux transporter [Treponemataceae bacterium]|nr:MATE family efflux transporter [Treponemataceae bacterium]
MKDEARNFYKTMIFIAIPVALQCMLNSSFSIIDQIMIGQLGSTAISAVGLAGKFFGIFNVIIGAISGIAGIMISQYIGKNNSRQINKSFYVNLLISVFVALVFTVLCIFFPKQIIKLYIADELCIEIASVYLRIISVSFVPVALISIISTMIRCMEKPSLPLYATIVASVLNTALNYALIFGKFGFAELGVTGAGIATVSSQIANALLLVVFILKFSKKNNLSIKPNFSMTKTEWKNYFAMLIPLFVCEFLWVLGENVYAVIYGHLGTLSCAGMTLTYPIQGLLIGSLSGLSQGAGIIIGKSQGMKEEEKSYADAKRTLFFGLAVSVLFSLLLILMNRFYINLYKIEDDTKNIGSLLLIAFAIYQPVKVLNMILGNGIIRSGGKTKINMIVDIIGTWGFGVPLGLLSAFVFNLPIHFVYSILSFEEVIRLVIMLVVFKKRIWINQIQ